MKFENFLALFQKSRTHRAGGQWLVMCPAHEDKCPSLAVRDGGDRILLHCHAGCSLDDILDSQGLRQSDLYFERRARTMGSLGEVEARYNYENSDGCPLYTVTRFANKQFRQSHLDGQGNVVWNMEGVGYVLYHLPRVLLAKAQHKPIFIVEGEKDVLTAETLGRYATTNAGGAGKWLSSYTETLTGCHCVVIPDNDAPGRQHAYAVIDALLPVALSARLLALPVRKQHEDLSDWVERYGGTNEQLGQLAKAARVIKARPDKDAAFRRRVLDTLDALRMETANPFVEDACVVADLRAQIGALIKGFAGKE